MDDRQPQRIGPYKILETIGEGGMGTVYLAEQSEPVRRQVALKVIKLGMDTREIVARFAQERQALALMSHPNIANLIDAGATEDGRPFFVMEHVSGRSLSDYADSARLSIDERLELFSTVCGAVEHAHDRGIVHRDLKPGNVLVSEGADGPRPRIIDFGIAKAVGPRLTDLTVHTHLGTAMGTPAYMSPEQASAKLGRVDARTDVYSLGVMLYQLLAGVLPIDFDAGEWEFDEIRRAIVETVPPPPSVRLKRITGDAGEELARNRASSPPGLRQRIRGDLDRVVMKAIDKDPALRYRTVGELAADVERARMGEPVLASPPGAMVRARRLARSPRIRRAASWLVTVAAVVAVVYALQEPSRRQPSSPQLPEWTQVTFRGDLEQSAISGDGEWLAYVSPDESGRKVLHLLELESGSEAREIARHDRIGSIDWSAESRYLLFAHQEAEISAESKGISRVDRESGEVVRVEAPFSDRVRWVGKDRIATAGMGSDEIRIGRPGNAEVDAVPIPWEKDWIVDLEPSPDGRAMAVVLLLRAEYLLGRLAVDGSGSQVLLRSADTILAPRWSEDGHSIRYVHGVGADASLMQQSLPAIGEELPPARPLLAGVDPSWEITEGQVSSDFLADRWAYLRQISFSNLWEITLPENGRQPLVRQLTSGSTQKIRPAVSPDGEWVVFSDRQGNTSDLYRMRLSGGEAERLTELRADWINDVVWAPTGEELLFSVWGGDHEGIWTVDPAGGAPRPIPEEPRAGGEIVWISDETLWIRDQGNQSYRVLRGPNRGQRAFDASGSYLFTARMSPDGTRLAYTSSDRQARCLYVRSLADSTEDCVVENRLAYVVAWTPDGNRLYFVDRKDSQAIFRVDLQTREIERFQLPFATDYRTVAMQPDGRSFVAGVKSEMRDVWFVDGLNL